MVTFTPTMPPVMEPTPLTPQEWHTRLTSDAYSLAQLKALCYQLGLDPDNFPHDTKLNLVNGLVPHLQKHGRLPDLATADAQRTTRHTDSLASYRQQVLAETQYLELKGIPLPQRRDGRTDTPHIPLDKIYIQLQAVADEEKKNRERAEAKALEREAQEAFEREASPKSPFDVLMGLRTLGEYFYRQGKVYEAAERPQPVDPQTALAEHKRLVILGAPGAGKSTLLRYLARRTAENEAGQLPIHISLRDFAVAYDSNRTLTLREYALQRAGGGETLRLALQTAIEQGRVLWLLDGLDETRFLQNVPDEISRQASQLPGGLLLSSRPVGYSEGGFLRNLPHFEVLPLTPAKVEQFLHDWMAIFAEEEEGETAVAERVTALQKQLAERPQLQALTRNPLLLTFMVVLGSLQGARPLPHKRADLYALYLEQLQAWEMGRLAQASNRPNAFEFRVGTLAGEKAKKVVAEGLNYLGWALFLNYYGGRATQAPTPDALIQQVAGYFAQDGYGESEDLAKNVLDFWSEAGMLDIWTLEGHKYLAFRHFTFLEYAAAWGLRRAWKRNGRGTWQFLKPRLHHPAWREPILLWGGGLPAAGINKVLRRLRWGVSSDENILHRDLLLAAALLAENDKADPKIAERMVRQMAWLGRSHPKKQLLVLILIWLGIPFGLLFALLPFGWGLLITIICIAFLTSIIVIPKWLDIEYYFEASSNLARFEKQISSTFIYLYRQHLILLSSLHLNGLGSTPFLPVYQYLTIQSTVKIMPYLVAALTDESELVRETVVQTMGQLKSERVVPHLVKMLHDEDSIVARASAQALGHIEASEAILELIHASQDPDWRVREAVAKALKNINRGDDVIPELIDRLRDKSKYDRWVTIEVLGNIGNAKATTHLIPLLKDEDIQIRGAAATALGQIGDPSSIPFLVSALQNDIYQDKALLNDNLQNEDLFWHDNFWKGRWRIGHALGQIGIGSMPYLVDALQDKHWEFRRMAAYALGFLGDISVPHLVNALQDQVWRVRVVVVESLGTIANQDTISPLIPYLQDESTWVRRSVIKALGQIGGTQAKSHLLTCLQNESFDIREAGCAALGRIKDITTVQPLIRMLQDEDKWVRLEAAKALGQIKHKQAVPYLISTLKDDDENVHSASIIALGEIGSSEATPYLTQLLDDYNSETSNLVVQTLGQITALDGNKANVNTVRKTLRMFTINPLREDCFYQDIYSQVVQRLTELTVRELPLNDPLRPSPPHPLRAWFRSAGWLVVTAVAIVLTETAAGLLADQLGAYWPTGVAGGVALATVLLFLLGFGRWLEK